MPSRRIPSLCLHKGTGQAVVRIDGKDHYLGKYGPRAVVLPLPLVRDALSRVAIFAVEKKNRSGDTEVKYLGPPDYAVKAVAARGNWPGIRSLAGIVEHPVLRPDGTLLDHDGYDPQTGLLLELKATIPPVPSAPTAEDVRNALQQLLDLVKDFPFAQPEHRSTWLAYLFTPLARSAFSGPAPLFLLDSNVRGAGKGLLADTAALITTGRPIPRMASPDRDEEVEKRITALALAGVPFVLLDNVAGSLGCASLDAALTSTSWSGRVLGKSETVEVPLAIVWAASGNNVILRADTARRTATIRIDSNKENPEERDDLTIADLRAHIRRERPRLLAAALTCLRAYCAAGRPDQRLKPWGSFEGWSALVRSCVVWLQQADPGGTRQEVRKKADEEGRALSVLLNELANIDGAITTSEILQMIGTGHNDSKERDTIREAVLILCPVRSGYDLPSPVALGKRLAHFVGRVCGGRYLYRDDDRAGFAGWTVKKVAADDADDADDTLPLSRGKENGSV